jgi:hypothetical protein
MDVHGIQEWLKISGNTTFSEKCGITDIYYEQPITTFRLETRQKRGFQCPLKCILSIGTNVIQRFFLLGVCKDEDKCILSRVKGLLD